MAASSKVRRAPNAAPPQATRYQERDPETAGDTTAGKGERRQAADVRRQMDEQGARTEGEAPPERVREKHGGGGDKRVDGAGLDRGDGGGEQAARGAAEQNRQKQQGEYHPVEGVDPH